VGKRRDGPAAKGEPAEAKVNMSTRFYEVAVLNPTLGGMVCAALLAKQGFRVLVLEDHAEEEASPPSPGATNPFVFNGFPNPALIQYLLAKLGVPLSIRQRFRPLEPSYQVVFPGFRINMERSVEQTLDHLAFHFPGHIEAIREFYQELEKIEEEWNKSLEQGSLSQVLMPRTRYPGVLRGLSHALRGKHGQGFLKFLAQRVPDLGFQQFAIAQLTAFGQVPPESLNMLEGARLLRIPFRGIGAFNGEPLSMMNFLREQLHLNGAEVGKSEGVSHFLWGGDQVTGFVLRTTGDEIYCHTLVVNQFHPDLETLISQKRAGRQHRDLAVDFKALSLAVHFGIDRRVIPRGMKDNIILVGDADQALEGRNLLAVSVGPPVEGLENLDRENLLRAVCFLSLEQVREHRRDEFRALTEDIFTNLADLIPFLDEFTSYIHLSPPETETAGPSRQPPAVLDPTVLGHHGIVRSPLNSLAPNLFILGRGNLPGFGVEGEILAGFAVAGKLCRDPSGEK